jgi:hypothetical protein
MGLGLWLQGSENPPRAMPAPASAAATALEITTG